MCSWFDSLTRGHLWVEFVVGSLSCSERFFSEFSDFSLSSETNIFKFPFDLDYCQAFYHEPLARVIAQALPVFDYKFTFTFTYVKTPFFLFLAQIIRDSNSLSRYNVEQ